MLKVKLYYPDFVALKDKFAPLIVYTEPLVARTPFSVWASFVGEPTRVFVVHQDEKPESFDADFPNAIRAETIAIG